MRLGIFEIPYSLDYETGGIALASAGSRLFLSSSTADGAPVLSLAPCSCSGDCASRAAKRSHRSSTLTR